MNKKIIIGNCKHCSNTIHYLETEEIQVYCSSCNNINLISFKSQSKEGDLNLVANITTVTSIKSQISKEIPRQIETMVIDKAEHAFNIIDSITSCSTIANSVIKIIKQIYSIYQNVKANKHQCKRLQDRLTIIQIPIEKLNELLKEQLEKYKKTKKCDIDIIQVQNIREILQNIEGLVKHSENVINDWSHMGDSFFGKLKQAFTSGKFGQEFEQITKKLKELLDDLKTNLIIQNFIKLNVQASNWENEDKEAHQKDIQELPQQIEDIVNHSGKKLEDLLKIVDWKINDMVNSFHQFNISISTSMLVLQNINEKVEEIYNVVVLKNRQADPNKKENLSKKWNNPASGEFWERVIEPKIKSMTNGQIEITLFFSAIFIQFLEPLEINYNIFEKIKPKLTEIFDKDKNGLIDIFEYDSATKKEDPLKICQRLIEELKENVNQKTVTFISTNTSDIYDIISTAPKYPVVTKKHEELIKKLIESKNEIVRDGLEDPKILHAFQSVPRSMFLPENLKKFAYEDNPIYDEPYHQSAPHMYVIFMCSVDINIRNKLSSFLCIGSGTGYLNTIIAVLQNWLGINHGIEINNQLTKFSKEKIQNFSETCNVKSNIKIFEGNCFEYQYSQKYQLIYVGAGCPKNYISKLLNLLEEGGKLFVPVGTEQEGQVFTVFMRHKNEFKEKKIIQVRYKMLQLPKMKVQKNHMHTFIEILPKKLGHNYKNGFKCDHCNKIFDSSTITYHCSECPDYDLCEVCHKRLYVKI